MNPIALGAVGRAALNFGPILYQGGRFLAKKAGSLFSSPTAKTLATGAAVTAGATVVAGKTAKELGRSPAVLLLAAGAIGIWYLSSKRK